MSRHHLMRGASVAVLSFCAIVAAQAQTPLPDIQISAPRPNTASAGRQTSRPVAAPTTTLPALVRESPIVERTEYRAEETVVGQKEIKQDKPRFSSTAQILQREPGVSMYQMGGVSGLPVIRGQADERIKVLVGGVQTTSACANHMNNPLSYTDPNTIEKVDVVYAVSSVSKGGDSTAGSIIVTPRSPVFVPQPATQAPAPAAKGKGTEIQLAPPILAASGLQDAPFLPWGAPGALRFGSNKEVLATGSISSFFRGNNQNWGVSGILNMATDHWSVLYNGSFQRANNYNAGGGMGPVYSTNFMAENHAMTLGYQNNGHLFTVRGTYQNIPFQGFPNMRMDMTRNRSYSIEAAYKGAFEWGTLDARAYWAQVWHKMGFLNDRASLNHPMINQGRDYGYSVKAEIPLTDKDLLRVGNELHGQVLQDYWPGDMTYGGMQVLNPRTGMWMQMPQSFSRPYDFVVINGGNRQRLGTYVELEHKWNQQWESLLGLRNDTVWMDTGTVQTYNPYVTQISSLPANGAWGPVYNATGINNVAANNFNASYRPRTNLNFDMTALTRYRPQEGVLYEAGYSRKTRTPSLYERYIWPVYGPYMGMFNWYGDGNGYTGNLYLKPEVAHTVSITGKWADTSGENNWEGRLTPYYSFIENYIQGGRSGQTFSFPNYSYLPSPTTWPFQILQFRNYNAQIYGVDGFGRIKLYEAEGWGRTSASATVSYVYGENLTIGNPSGCAPTNGVCAVTAVYRKTGDGLWNMMPLNSLFTLEHRLGGLSLAAEIQLVAAKDHVSAVQQEFRTPAYALLNLRSSYEWSNLRVDLGVDNVTDAYYAQPLGGFDLTQYYRNAVLVNQSYANASVRQVPGMGRNFYAGLTVKF
jgi:iron complex outermembrane receptor protein